MTQSIEVRIPTLGESITEAVIVRWVKADGEAVAEDEVLLELETEKASVEIPAEAAGVVKILKQEGETVRVGDVVARIVEGGAPSARQRPKAAQAEERQPQPAESRGKTEAGTAKPPPRAEEGRAEVRDITSARVTPLARRLADEHGVDTGGIRGSGRGGRVTKADVLAQLEEETEPEAEREVPAAEVAPVPEAAEEEERRVPMSPIRRRIAERLLEAQHGAAILTTFNEIDMSAVLELRRRYRDRFSETHGVSLGFMSFFARACVAALKEITALNAEIRDGDIVYKTHVHLGIAVGTPRGLVVPVVRYADRKSFADFEREIEHLAQRARDGKLTVEQLTGGTFSITNGGVFGSLLSTPILNPPQSGILGMHKIERRPVVVGDEIVVRPMMYVALSYDHRIVDGEQAVTFLVRVKERIEDPSRLLLEV